MTTDHRTMNEQEQLHHAGADAPQAMNAMACHGNPADLATILEAWHAATLRLEQTHEALRAEVKRLTAELERKNRELARKDRLADLGRMAAHIAHELRNSLMPISLYLSLLKRRIKEKEPQEITSKIEQAVQAAQTVLNDILQFAADREPQESLFEVKKLLISIIDEIEIQTSSQKVAVRIEASDSLFVWADRDLLRRVIVNLLLNALDAMPNGGELIVSVDRSQQDLIISVTDTGPGLSEEALQHAFEPFFTTKPSGTGLGLAIVEHFIQLHGGSVSVQNRPQGGASFQIVLPNRCVVPSKEVLKAA